MSVFFAFLRNDNTKYAGTTTVFGYVPQQIIFCLSVNVYMLCVFVSSHYNSEISIPEREGLMITRQKHIGLFLTKFR